MTKPNFRPPFACGIGAYHGITYPGHSPFSVDFNRGVGGTDLGDPVLASAAGLVFDIRVPGDIRIRHEDGYETWYVHCQGIKVHVGSVVKQGQQIAEIGSVGASSPHLHVNHARFGQQIPIEFDGVRYPGSVGHMDTLFTGPLIEGWCPPPEVRPVATIGYDKTKPRVVTVKAGAHLYQYPDQPEPVPTYLSGGEEDYLGTTPDGRFHLVSIPPSAGASGQTAYVSKGAIDGLPRPKVTAPTADLNAAYNAGLTAVKTAANAVPSK